MMPTLLVWRRPWRGGHQRGGSGHWTWMDCNGLDQWHEKIEPQLGPPPIVCKAGLDFTCPVHPRSAPIAVSPIDGKAT